MKVLASVLGLLITVGIVALLAKKQLPAAPNADATQATGTPAVTPQQVKQQLEAITLQPRPLPE